MLKRITSAAIAALALSAPVIAAPAGLDQQHQYLWDTLEEKGVWGFVNPEQVCQDPNRDLDGAYFYSPSVDRPILVVCQDNRTKVDEQVVEWTDNDLDTIRHESMHYLQDCLDGDLTMTLTPFYDGPGGAPGNLTYAEVISGLGAQRADTIAYFYGEKLGANDHTIRVEHEAFYVASYVPAYAIAQAIEAFCPAK